MSDVIKKYLALTLLSALVAFVGCTAAWQLAFAADSVTPNVTIEYTGSEASSGISASELFDTSSSLMPGDTATTTLTVKNDCANACTVWLTAKNAATAEQPGTDSLAQAVLLSIADQNGQAVYVGDLSAQDLAEGISLGKVSAGGTYTLSFSLTVPSELGNAYALTQAGQDWVISLAQQENESTQSSSPRTGDSLIGVLVCLAAIALSGAIIIATRIHDRRKEQRK